jgi:tetratricopeptide (TPR) repeat protein
MVSVAPSVADPRTAERPWPNPRLPDRGLRVEPGWLAVAVTVALAACPLAQGYFRFQVWGALALGLLVIVIVLLRVRRPAMTGPSAIAAAGLAAILALSTASWLWAESKEAVWTDTNRLAFYCAVFAIVVLAVRDHRSARLMMITLGASALLVSLWLCASMLLGEAQGDFAGRRLNSPIGYINGNAALLVMGIWPWLALAETAKRSSVRAWSLGAASLIAGTCVLTQSRAVLPASLAAVILVLGCAGGRTTRAFNLLLVAVSVAAGITWTLRVYSVGGASARSLPPGQNVLRNAAVAIAAAAVGAALLRLAVSWCAGRLGVDRAGRAHRRFGTALALVALPLLIAGVVAAAPGISRQYASFTAMRFNDAAPVRLLDAGGYRYDLWRVALREFERHPFAGLGAGNYDTEYYRLRRNPEYVLQPHSLELQMAGELGIGGVLALLVFCGAVVWACFSRRTLASGDRFVKVAAAGTFAAWLAGTSVDWLYDIPGLTAMAIAAAALLVLPAGPARRISSSGQRLRPAIAAAVVVVFAASIGRQYAATHYAKLGTGQVAQRPEAAIANLREAAALDPYSLPTLYALSAAYARRNDYTDARATLLSAAAREPHNFVPPALLGDLAMRRGTFRQAAAEYSRAVTLDPHDPAVRSALAHARKAR